MSDGVHQLLGGAAVAWPLARTRSSRGGGDRAAQRRVERGLCDRIAASPRLREQGFVEGQNLTIEYRSATVNMTATGIGGRSVRRQVAVIVALADASGKRPGRRPRQFGRVCRGSDAVNSGLVKVSIGERT